MPKISSGYTEDTELNPDAWIVISTPLRDKKYKARLANLGILSFHNKMLPAYTEFLGTTSVDNDPFNGVSILSGTASAQTDVANHRGIWRLTSAASSNSGYYIGLNMASSVLISGGETAEFIFSLPVIAGNLVNRLGFLDAVTVSNPIDGVFLSITGAVISGKTFSNSSTSTTATTYTLSVSTWYRGKVEINNTATLATFTIYDDNGNVLWTDSLSTNIPTGAGRETGFAVNSVKNNTGATDLIDLDWMAYYNYTILTR